MSSVELLVVDAGPAAALSLESLGFVDCLSCCARSNCLQVCELLLEGGHVGGGGLLVFGDVVVFGMVVFGVLIVVAGFFIRVFIS